MIESKYRLRGVSPDKEDVYEAIKNLDKGIFPNSFCKILPDIVGNSSDFCNIMHADTAGTKSSLAYLYWKETGDVSVWSSIAQDAIVMNIDDMACCGAVDNFILSSTICRNKNHIDSSVLSSIIDGTLKFIEKMSEYDINMTLSGGETADVGDIVKTIDVGFTAFTRVKKSQIIDIKIKPGDVIVGLASYGKSTYESEFNSGIGCNGLTSARHDILHKDYSIKYPESYDNLMNDELVYSGSFRLGDKEKTTGIEVGKLLLSPTRTFLPVLKSIIDKHRSNISGIVHCTGGSQTKVLKFCKNLHIIKDNLFQIPNIFRIIQSESSTSSEEMYKVFNMGSRLEIYTDANTAKEIIKIANNFNIESQIIGRVKESKISEITIDSELGTFHYRH